MREACTDAQHRAKSKRKSVAAEYGHVFGSELSRRNQAPERPVRPGRASSAALEAPGAVRAVRAEPSLPMAAWTPNSPFFWLGETSSSSPRS